MELKKDKNYSPLVSIYRVTHKGPSFGFSKDSHCLWTCCTIYKERISRITSILV
jgi:hypothetical protein